MNTKPTLKDIANATGFSLISIHRAIYHKEGLSDETREKILKAVKDMGYEVNFMASALKRKPITIAFVVTKPRIPGNYYENLWKGGVSSFQEVSGLNCVRRDYLFQDGSGEEKQFIEEIYASTDIDGVVIVPSNTRLELQVSIEKLVAKGIPVVLVDDKFDNMDYLCCISPRGDLIGRLGAEFLCKVARPGKILVVHGNETSKTHINNMQGFQSYINESNLPFSLEIIHDPHDDNVLVEELSNRIAASEDVVGLYTIRERNTQALCRAAFRFPERKLEILGSDLCPGNVEYLKKGVMVGLIDKNPFQRGYLGMHVLVEYLLKNEKPKARLLSVPISIVMNSNLPLFSREEGSGICITTPMEGEY